MIIERVKIVLREPAFSGRLMIYDLSVRQADLGNQSPEVRVRIIESLDDIDHLAIVEAKAGEVLISLGIGQPVYQAIEPPANPEHDRVFATRLLNRDDDRGTLLPFP